MINLDVVKARNKQLEGQRPIPYAIKIHLELDRKEVDEKEKCILAKYGKMIHGISRDIVVPGDMTLHSLHYVINRAFGWQNSHLHSFHPYKEDYNRMTLSGKFTKWANLVGMYFRFPCEDFGDIYWDDDYRTTMSVKNWLREKYTGPYYYGGTREYYDRCQQDIKELIERIAPTSDMTLKELAASRKLSGAFDELIERILLYDILLMPGMEQTFDSWYFSNRRTLQNCDSKEEGMAPVTTPILHALHYWYDYGDDWNVRITATACYETKKKYEASGNPIKPIEEHRPVCVDADGLSVCDDVGGIDGYCNMLEILHGEDDEEKEAMKEWSKNMGWSGRKVRPENLL